MRDPITDAAQDPSCLLCLTPDRGGSWWSRLRPDGPWPSPVPENFAENAKAFYDCQAVVQEALDPTHDYSFLIEADRVSERTENSLFYAGTDKLPFGVYYHADHTIKFFTNLLRNEGDPSGTYANLNFYTGTDWLLGRHAFEARIEGNAITTYVDGVQCATSNKFARTGTAAVGIPNCNSGYVYKIQITDLTDNQVVWSYPSEAERVRLITKTNVRTDRGAFEAADENTIAGVATQLDLRGNATSKTFIVRAFCPAHDPASGKLYIHPFFGQGAINQSASLYTFQFSLWEDRRSGGTTQLFPTISTGTDTPGANVTGAEIYLDQWHTYAMVIDYNGGNCYIRAFVDGVLLRERTVSGTPAWNTSATTTAQETTVGIRRDPNASYYAGSLTRITAALVFDRALSAAEIAALTPKKQPLSWAGIRDVVRRGRAQRYFAVGDVLTIATPRWNIEYEVVGFDQVEPADAALTHSMTLLPVRLVTAVQFDAPEPGNPIMDRPGYGCNRWDWSSIRLWLNSTAAPGEWWTPQHEYDAAPAYAATLAGFMADLPADFLNAVAPARLVTALPNADGGGSVETVDRFWLPSRTEIFGALNGGIAEGVQMAKYIDATDADRIKQGGNGAAARWRLRSANLSQAHPVYLVSSDGTFFVAGHGAAVEMGIVPACIIA